MLRRYGAGVLAGSHSVIYSSSSQARLEIPSATEKHKGKKQNSLVSELSAILPPSSGMSKHRQSGKQIPLRHSADV